VQDIIRVMHMTHPPTIPADLDRSALPRFNVLGVGVNALTLRAATDAIVTAARIKKKGYVCVADVNVISHAQRDPDFRRLLNESFLTTSDGMPLVWLGRRAYGSWVERVYGPDLLLSTFQASSDGGVKHFFYGGAPGVPEILRDNMRVRFPGAQVVGAESPPFRPLIPGEIAALKEKVEILRPDIFWVGLGAPKQERFIAEFSSVLDATVMIGVGAAFDFHSGRVKQAPIWMQRNGFEWLFRLLTQPRRLAKRYAVNVPLFLIRIALQLSGLRKYPLPSSPHSD
jgi:N-acetylglucosaminyldiphosphoundecaprenol N-acetyl-beta-D-mannosaminyltransferase